MGYGRYKGNLTREEWDKWILHVRDGFKSPGEKSNLAAFRGKRNLNLGCGCQPEPVWKGWVNADIGPNSHADVRFDMRRQWPFVDECFDMALGYRVFQMFEPGEEIFHVFAEAWRVLKPGGYLVGCVPLGHLGGPFQKMIWGENTPLLMTRKVYYESELVTTGWDQGMPVKDWEFVGHANDDLLLFVLRRPLI